MTSGQFHSIEITRIIVHREERQRADLSDIETLADSINRLGLIHPIVITRDCILVAGERRLAACVSLGHTHIACQYTDELDPPVLRCIELEENIKRSQLPWKDECLAVHEYYRLRRIEDPKFSEAAAAKAIGLSQQSVNDRLTVAAEIVRGNEMVISAPKFSTAKGIVERAAARKDEESLLSLRKIANTRTDPEIEEESIINADFLTWAPAYVGPKFNFVHCDFPYGIGADSFNQGAAPTHGGYTDSEDTYWALCKCLADNLNVLTTESCHFMFWFSMHYYQPTLDFFHRNTDIVFDPFPLVWLKSDNVGILPDPQRGPRRIYETALFGSRGDRKIVASTSNAYAAPTDRSQHMSIKPEPVLRNFFRMFVDEASLVLDPTCGSGTSLRAAESLNAGYVLGIEQNTEFAEGAKRALTTFRHLRKARS